MTWKRGLRVSWKKGRLCSEVEKGGRKSDSRWKRKGWRATRGGKGRESAMRRTREGECNEREEGGRVQ